MAKPEQELQLKVCEYIRTEYPEVIFLSEASGLRVTMGQAVLLKKMRAEFKLPDMFIAYPCEKFHGLFIELKIEGTTIYKKDKELVADKHIRAQHSTLAELYRLGYAATFGVGYEQTIKKIDGYLSGLCKLKKTSMNFDEDVNKIENKPNKPFLETKNEDKN